MPRGAGAPVRAAGGARSGGRPTQGCSRRHAHPPHRYLPATIRVGNISDEAPDQHSGTFLARQCAYHENCRCTAVGSTPAPTLSERWGDVLRYHPSVCSLWPWYATECGDELADEHAVLGHALGTARDLIALFRKGQTLRSRGETNPLQRKSILPERLPRASSRWNGTTAAVLPEIRVSASNRSEGA